MGKNKIFYAMIFLFFVLLLIGPKYDFSLLSTGIYLTPKNTSLEDLKVFYENVDVLFEEESLYQDILVESRKGLINVKGEKFELDKNMKTFFGDLRLLKLNGKIQCGSGRPDMTTTGLLGGLPVALNKEGDVLNIGLGCGLTLGVLEKGNFQNIYSLEIDPFVVEAAREFDDIHENAIDDPRSKIIIDDARNFLLKTDKKYDVIVNEPSPPYSSSNSANLMTKEFFLEMKDHLKEDGVIVQWVPFRLMNDCEKPGFDVFYKTFSSVFPNNHVFVSKSVFPISQTSFVFEEGLKKVKVIEDYDYPNKKFEFGEMIIVASREKIDIDKIFNNFDSLDSNIREYYEKIRIKDLRNNYLYSSEEVVFSEETEIHTDDKPVLEFLSAKSFYLTRSEAKCEN